MALSSEHSQPLFDGRAARRERVIEGFERAWLDGKVPAIEDWCPIGTEDADDILAELVHVDLELAFKTGAARRIEDYLTRFPRLAVDRDVVIELIAAEFDFRRKRDPHASCAEYLQRFPDYRTELQARFGLHAAADSSGAQRRQATSGLKRDHLPATVSVDAGASSGAASASPTIGLDNAASSGHATGRTPSVASGKFFGHYELIEELARGGMGVVYRARDRRLNRTVALKMILAGAFASTDVVKRFHTEAEAAAKLAHQGIVPIYDVGEVDGQHYLAMALVEGEGLDARLRLGPLPPPEAAEMIRAVAVAVNYAHEQGVIHRDLKPQNILLDVDGRPTVTDFGLAKLRGADRELTMTGQVLGTPGYMPPEQASSGGSKSVGPAADVYSLGAVLYAILTGRPPFQAASVMETLQQVLETEPVSPRLLNAAVPRELEAICLKCLEKDAHRRYASARELADDLSRFLAGEPTRARPPSIGVALRSWLRQHLQATLVMVIVGVLCGGTAAAVLALGVFPRWRVDIAVAYRELPNVEPGWHLILRPLPAPILGALCMVGIGAFLSMGLLSVVLTRRRDDEDEIWIGAGTGLIAGVTAFTISFGWAGVLGQTFSSRNNDIMLLGMAIDNPELLLEKYPDLEHLPPGRRIRILAAKIVADLSTRIQLGIWIGMFGSIVLFTAFGASEAWLVGRLLHAGSETAGALKAYYGFFLLSVFAISLVLPPTGIGIGLLPEYLPDPVTGNIGLLLIAVTIVGLVGQWRLLGSLFIALGVNLLRGTGDLAGVSPAVDALAYTCVVVTIGFNWYQATHRETSGQQE